MAISAERAEVDSVWDGSHRSCCHIRTVMQAGALGTSDPEIMDGTYVLYVKGSGAHEVSRQVYMAVGEARLRIATVWLAVGWFQAAGLWWTELKRAPTHNTA